MFKKTAFLLLACLSANTVETVPSVDTPKTSKSNRALDAFTFFTNIQPSQLNKSNAKNIFAPIIALHALEHFLCGNNHLGRKLTGDTNNPNRAAALSLWIAAKLAFHVIPALLKGDGFLQGVKGFINSCHLARMALVTPFRVQDRGAYIFSRLASILLIANQYRLVNNVHKRVIQECKELGIEKPFEKTIVEPSPTHVRLPRYLTQDFGVFMAQWFVHRLIYETNYEHFNKEFWDDDIFENGRIRSEVFWPGRKFNEHLLKELKISDEAMAMRAISPFLCGFGKLGSAIYGGMASMLTNGFLILRERAKDENALPGETNPEIINSVLGKNTFLCLEPCSLFISKETFEQLSHNLQASITQLNNQELIFNAYNLTNPLTEHAFALAQYTYKTEVEDFPVSIVNNLSPESIKRRIEKHKRNLKEPKEYLSAPSRLDYEMDNLPRILQWEKDECHEFYAGPAWYLAEKHNNILNYKEQTLMNFIPINAETTSDVRASARRYAKEVLKKKPVSRLAKKVINLTADLEKNT